MSRVIITSGGLNAIASADPNGPYFPIKYFLPVYDFRYDSTIMASPLDFSATASSGDSVPDGEVIFNIDGDYTLTSDEILISGGTETESGGVVDGSLQNNTAIVNLFDGEPLSNVIEGSVFAYNTPGAGQWTVTDFSSVVASSAANDPTLYGDAANFFEVASYSPITISGTTTHGLFKCRIGKEIGVFKFNKVALYVIQVDSTGAEISDPILFAIAGLKDTVRKSTGTDGISEVELDVELEFVIDDADLSNRSFVGNDQWVRVAGTSGTDSRIYYDGGVAISEAGFGWDAGDNKLKITNYTDKNALMLSYDDTVNGLVFAVNAAGVTNISAGTAVKFISVDGNSILTIDGNYGTLSISGSLDVLNDYINENYLQIYYRSIGGVGHTQFHIGTANGYTYGSPIITATNDGDILGLIDFLGVNSSDSWARGFVMTATCTSAVGTNVPTTVKFETYGPEAINENQLVLRDNGTIGMGVLVPEGSGLHIRTSEVTPLSGVSSYNSFLIENASRGQMTLYTNDGSENIIQFRSPFWEENQICIDADMDTTDPRMYFCVSGSFLSINGEADIIPFTTNKSSLGSDSYLWKKIYSYDLTSEGNAYLNGVVNLNSDHGDTTIIGKCYMAQTCMIGSSNNEPEGTLHIQSNAFDMGTFQISTDADDLIIQGSEGRTGMTFLVGEDGLITIDFGDFQVMANDHSSIIFDGYNGLFTFTIYNENIVNIFSTGQVDFPKQSRASIYVGTPQLVPSGGIARVAFDTESYDIRGEFDTPSNSFSPQEDGYYLIETSINVGPYSTWSSGDILTLELYNGDTVLKSFDYRWLGTDDTAYPWIILHGKAVVKLIAGDVINLKLSASPFLGPTAMPTISSGSTASWITFTRIP